MARRRGPREHAKGSSLLRISKPKGIFDSPPSGVSVKRQL